MRPKDAYRGKRRGHSDYTLNCSGGFCYTPNQGDRISVPLSPKYATKSSTNSGSN